MQKMVEDSSGQFSTCCRRRLDRAALGFGRSGALRLEHLGEEAAQRAVLSGEW